MRIALGIEYDGREYFGWQSQRGGRTVQDALQIALSSVANEPIAVIAAGRTDTGVHALEQVVHFNVSTERPIAAWVRGVNALLPKNVAVLWAHPVSEEFHARFSAQARSYRYVLINRSVRNAIQQGRAGWFHAPLNLQKMRDAAQYLLGEHDFSAFRAAECQAKSPIKKLMQLDIEKQDDIIIFDLSANSFLHHMVRNIVGCLVYIGKGKYPSEWMHELLESRKRIFAAPTFASDGLYLRRIIYDQEWRLPHVSNHSQYLVTPFGA